MLQRNYQKPDGRLQSWVFRAAFAAAAFAPYSAAAQTANTNWVDWDIPSNFTDYQFETTPGGLGSRYNLSITGTATIPGTSVTITITHTGEVNSYSENNSSNWSNSYGLFDATTAYTQSPDISPNSPDGSDMLVQTGYTSLEGKRHKLAFSAPVSNVLMAFWSLGSPRDGASLTFSQSFKIISANNLLTCSRVFGPGIT